MSLPAPGRQPAPEPPWVAHPGFPPADSFWRQSGEHWLKDVWRPVWDAMSGPERRDYLQAYPPPREWRDYYLDPDFQAWLEADDGS